MRQIVLDTETTGLHPSQGHRIVEIAALEMIDRKLTGKHYQTYINPEREVDLRAEEITGLNLKFLRDKPLFKAVKDEFWQFVKGAELIIHNAPFDLGFINHELKLVEPQHDDIRLHCQVIDTVIMARNLYPGQRCDLDTLCRKFKISLSDRSFHGALLDTELLAAVYLNMTSGQTSFDLTPVQIVKASVQSINTGATVSSPEVCYADAKELEAHLNRLTNLKAKTKTCLWPEEVEPN